MNVLKYAQQFNRRQFVQTSGIGLGAFAVKALQKKANGIPHPAAKAKRVIYMFQSGAPSQLETFDYKPNLVDIQKTELPDSIRQGQRLTGMTSGQKSFPIAPSKFRFNQHGESGAWVSELLPYTAKVADDLCIINSMQTDAINHDPAITFCQTGFQLAGRPSMGAWVAYGLGTANENLPAYVVMVSRGTGRAAGQPLYDRLWGSGFLPGKHQGVKLRSGQEAVLYLDNPAGCTTQLRREMLDDISSLNQIKSAQVGDPEIETRISQYELAFRMQTAVPEITDISDEPEHILEMYGPDVRKPGTYARNCLLARKMAERDVRFIQLFHMGWDQHNDLPDHMSKQCKDTDQASAALIQDLKQRGMLDDTLVVWGGEFGRTVYCQGKFTDQTYGRDHHPRNFSIWMAGGGIKPGITYGKTDDFSYNVTENPVEVFDLNATILHQLGLDHEQLTWRFQGRDYRLTDVHGRVLQDLIV
ncbi:MAG: DUF1501 domain-containing protein [Planctomycetaceae bacterium]|nr:DUF1501 domain-containing protein [Planctomycetaceae bacterium]MCP4461296.1 DUF1501 domain-containing protein [Planctomycetaceae bacterium]MDG1808637.1 DUF1501 domain-containing protein [Pirellulaceae bacterium]MDG2103280.1 DUF1501 domain-containing protein [Pirellulaceae bacterium]